MRLIDADEYKGKCVCNHLYSGVTRLIEIEAIPTAFDIGSVIKELEDQKSGLTTWAEDEAYKLGIEKAIEIVKSAVNAMTEKNGE